MKFTVLPLALAVLLCFAPPGEARSHGGHHHHHHHHRFFGSPVFVGPWPWWGPYWYPGYPPYARRVVIQPEQWVYIERPSTPTTTYWYYCPDGRAYYPNVQQCPSPWLRVAPAPTTLAP